MDNSEEDNDSPEVSNANCRRNHSATTCFRRGSNALLPNSSNIVIFSFIKSKEDILPSETGSQGRYA